MEIDRTGLAEFLRRRREALQPEDVGLPRGQRRRTEGLRREEVAALCHMSADYYARLERGRGPSPSEQMIASIAQGLHLGVAERDHVFLLAGHVPPVRGAADEQHIAPGLLRILDRLDDTPAEIVTELGETLRQTRMGIALTGDLTVFHGPARSIGYRWFTDPAEREHYPEADHEQHSRTYVANLRAVHGRDAGDAEARALVELLRTESPEFARLWDEHQVSVRRDTHKRIVNPAVGLLELDCQILTAENQTERLVVFTAAPGSEDAEKLKLLAVVGNQSFAG